jgi:predicted phage tail protein
MKWKDLSLKERKQIYDSVRANNPDATYFDIKEQFDSIPTYEDGKGKTINKADLPPEYRTGTPEYFERQRKISGAVNAVQPEAYITPAGYIKDAVNFIEDLGKGDYAGAAIDAALNLIPWGVGKTIKKIKKKVGRAIEGTDAYTAESYAEPFTPTITKKKKGKKVKTEADYDQEFAEVKRKYNNMQEYDKELSKITNDLFMPTDGSVETLEKVDKAYGTNYKKAASAIAFQDMANRGKYVKHQQMYDSAGNPIYGRTTGKVISLL